MQAALADIFERRIEWNPDDESLLHKVCDVIRYRARDQKESLPVRTPHVSIDQPGGNADGGEAEDIEERPLAVDGAAARAFVDVPEDPEAQLAREQERQRERDAGARLGAELAAMAAGDAQVEAIVRCLRGGVTRKADVLAETGMTSVDYHNAKRRFDRLTERLPAELRALAEGEQP